MNFIAALIAHYDCETFVVKRSSKFMVNSAKNWLPEVFPKIKNFVAENTSRILILGLRLKVCL